MNPVKRIGTLKDGTEFCVLECSVCGCIKYSEQEAEDCCKPKMCACGKPVESPYIVCKQCRDEAERKRDQAIWDKAKKVKWEDYDGEQIVCDRDDEFYSDPDEIFDAYYSDPPTWAWGTYSKKLMIDAQRVIDEAIENEGAFEGAPNYVPDLTHLQNALDDVCAMIPETYWKDETVVVTFEEEAEEYRKEIGE